MMARLQSIAHAYGSPEFDTTFAREFAQIGGISIDYAVMEHAENVVLIEAPFDWDDLGSWQALARQRGQDADGNTIAAKHLGIKTTGTIVYGQDAKEHLIVTVGRSGFDHRPHPRRDPGGPSPRRGIATPGRQGIGETGVAGSSIIRPVAVCRSPWARHFEEAKTTYCSGRPSSEKGCSTI